MKTNEITKTYAISGQIIGKGSFATVYKATHRSTQQLYAVKVISLDRTKNSSRSLLARLDTEIKIMRQIHHDNIIALIETERTSTHLLIVLEYCNGGDLSQFLKRYADGLEEMLVVNLLGQFGQALFALRQFNLIHRDLKPANILLHYPSPRSPQDNSPPLRLHSDSYATHFSNATPSSSHHFPILKVADFGFARQLETVDMAETVCGSPLYMAPEILRFEKYDAKADLWSVGAILYEMMVGKPPFKAANHIDLLRKIQSTPSILFPDEKSTLPSCVDEFDAEFDPQQLSLHHPSTIDDPWGMTTPPNSAPANVTSIPRLFSASLETQNQVRNIPMPRRRGTISSGVISTTSTSRSLKSLVRSLLRKDPNLRLGFDAFFRHPCVCGNLPSTSLASLNPHFSPNILVPTTSNVSPTFPLYVHTLPAIAMPARRNRDAFPPHHTHIHHASHLSNVMTRHASSSSSPISIAPSNTLDDFDLEEAMGSLLIGVPPPIFSLPKTREAVLLVNERDNDEYVLVNRNEVELEMGSERRIGIFPYFSL